VVTRGRAEFEGSRRRRSEDAIVCVVCDEPTGRADVELCSRSCLDEARAEIEANVAAARGADGDRRLDLMERNGTLTSALIRWSPE
jgi:hypothetical protein